jgi:hypothetical protein
MFSRGSNGSPTRSSHRPDEGDDARIVVALDLDDRPNQGLGDLIEIGGFGNEDVIARESLRRGVRGRHAVAALAARRPGAAHRTRFSRSGLEEDLPLAPLLPLGRDVGEVDDTVGIGVRVHVGARRPGGCAGERDDRDARDEEETAQRVGVYQGARGIAKTDHDLANHCMVATKWQR